jgi:hypothetical protein
LGVPHTSYVKQPHNRLRIRQKETKREKERERKKWRYGRAIKKRRNATLKTLL